MLNMKNRSKAGSHHDSQQLSYLAFKIKGSLEVAKQYIYNCSDDLEAVKRIEKALHSTEILISSCDKTSSS